MESAGDRRLSKDLIALEMFVVDVLRYDIEQISSIVNLLNNTGCIGWRDQWPADFQSDEIVSVIPSLVGKGYVDVYVYSKSQNALVPACEAGFMPEGFAGNENAYWFLLTKKGMAAWELWSPPDQHNL